MTKFSFQQGILNSVIFRSLVTVHGLRNKCKALRNCNYITVQHTLSPSEGHHFHQDLKEKMAVAERGWGGGRVGEWGDGRRLPALASLGGSGPRRPSPRGRSRPQPRPLAPPRPASGAETPARAPLRARPHGARALRRILLANPRVLPCSDWWIRSSALGSCRSTRPEQRPGGDGAVNSTAGLRKGRQGGLAVTRALQARG